MVQGFAGNPTNGRERGSHGVEETPFPDETPACPERRWRPVPGPALHPRGPAPCTGQHPVPGKHAGLSALFWRVTPSPPPILPCAP